MRQIHNGFCAAFLAGLHISMGNVGASQGRRLKGSRKRRCECGYWRLDKWLSGKFWRLQMLRAVVGGWEVGVELQRCTDHPPEAAQTRLLPFCANHRPKRPQKHISYGVVRMIFQND